MLGSDRPQRRTALVGRELGSNGIKIAVLSETRCAEVGEIKEFCELGYTFFWSGRKSEERREAGVAYAIKSELVGKLSGLPKGISYRLMTLRFPLSCNKHATIISANAPTMTNPDEVKDNFYDDLDRIISATTRTDKLILHVLGDFNAKVSRGQHTLAGVIGSEGVGKCNSNGLLLLRKCAEHDLLITNTVFRLSNRNKTSWMHPRLKHWHLIDYIIVRRTDRQDVRVVQTAGQITDWLLANSTKDISLLGDLKARKLLSKLNQGSMRQAFINDICPHLGAMHLSSEDQEENWTVFQNVVYSSAATTLGHISRMAHQDNTSSVSKKAAFGNIRKTVQNRLRDMQASWLSKKAEEIQSFADRTDMKKFRDELKTVHGPNALEPLHCLVQMEAHFLLIKMGRTLK